MKKSFSKIIRRIVPPRWREDWADYRHFRSLKRESPELIWRVGPRSPQKCVEAGRVRLGDELYVLGGYITLGTVSQSINVFNLKKRKWTKTFTLPSTVPQTHNGWTTDGQRYLFSIAGQLGANCSPSVASCFAWDTRGHRWAKLPSLPEPRYMPLVHFYEGRIHVFSGTQCDRTSPAIEHWSLGIKDGQATESRWREEQPMNNARTHTASHIVGDKLYVFGGQKGDVPPVCGDPDFNCDWDSTFDEIFDTVYAYDFKSGCWEALAPMPYKISHTEYAVVQSGQYVVIAGGVLDRMAMFDAVLAYNLKHDEWTEIGHLPYPMKSKIVAYHDGCLFLLNGQRSVSQYDLRPGEVLNSVWVAELSL